MFSHLSIVNFYLFSKFDPKGFLACFHGETNFHKVDGSFNGGNVCKQIPNVYNVCAQNACNVCMFVKFRHTIS